MSDFSKFMKLLSMAGLEINSGSLIVTQPDGSAAPAQMPAVKKSAVASLFPLATTTAVKAAGFNGWSAQFTTLPGLRFSHLLFPTIGQTAATAADKWARIAVSVKAGDRSGAVVASGQIVVGGYVSDLTNQYVQLFDAAGNPKILTGDDLGATYCVEYIAYNKNGGKCQVGLTAARPDNYIASTTWYYSSGGTWAKTASDAYPMGVQPAYYTAQALLPAPQAPIPDIILPPQYAVVGRECSVYFQGLCAFDAARVDWDVTYAGNGAQQQTERFTVIPDAVGSFALTIAALDPISGAVLASASTAVTVASASAAVTTALIAIGDSTTAYGDVTAEIVALDTADANTAVTLVGTKGTAPNKFEATSGWKTSNFVNSGSPFYIGGGLDITAYVANNSLPTPDRVIINLGINNIFNAASDSAAMLYAQSAIAELAQLIRAFQNDLAGVKIGIACTTAPSASQDAFGNTANYATGQTKARYKRNWAILCRQVLDAFVGQTAAGVWVLPYNTAIDTERNMITATVAANSRNSATIIRQANGVHPAGSGSQQVADVLYAWIKNTP